MTFIGGTGAAAPTVRLILLALVGGLLATFGGLPTATAAEVVPCTQTFAGTGMAIAPEDPANAPAYKWTVAPIQVPALANPSNVEDIDVTYDITHPHASNLATRLTRFEGGQVSDSQALQPRLPADSSAQVKPLTFDDEAAAAYAAASPTGRYRPGEPLSAFDGVVAGTTWRLDMANYENITTARLNSWSVTITYSACDGDGDGAEDHTDNCLGMANGDQLDLDGDRVGDGCDGDVDGDVAANGADNCPVVTNPDQADLDRDGAGDACEGDVDGDGLADVADGCPRVAGATTSGCPSLLRTISIDLVRKRKQLKGVVAGGPAGCRAQVEVTLWRKRSGRDRRLVIATTNDGGRYRIRAPRGAGKYYVSLVSAYLPGLAECSADRSPIVKLRR